jgi:putative ABC transport system permease protein
VRADQTLRIALDAVFANKLRALLTVLGIVIGVAAVIAMMAVGAGARREVEQTFAAMGTNILVVLPGSSATGGVQLGFGSKPTLTWEDLTAVRAETDIVKTAAPVLRSSATLVAEEQNWTTTVTGTTPAYFAIRDWPMDLGAAFSEPDLESGAKVVVLGQTVADRLFGARATPVGRTIRLRGIPFRIVAVAAKKGQSSTGQDYDDAAFIPATTYAQKVQGGLGKFLQGTILVRAVSTEATARAEVYLKASLRDRHRLAPDRDDDFSIRNLSDIASAQQEGKRTMTLLLASVAGISLFVGGIGIMNIMLVGVTERTREIGLRMALGATPKDILEQFLMEAIALALAGGLVGVAAGISVARWIADQFHWQTVVQPQVIAVAIGFSALVGIVFGMYPARKAASLDPIDALRFE